MQTRGLTYGNLTSCYESCALEVSVLPRLARLLLGDKGGTALLINLEDKIRVIKTRMYGETRKRLVIPPYTVVSCQLTVFTLLKNIA